MANWQKLVIGAGSSLIAIFSICFGLSELWEINSEGMSKVLGSTELGWSYASKFNYVISSLIPILLGIVLIAFISKFFRTTDVRFRNAMLTCAVLVIFYFWATRAIVLN
jgi:hypothetical protein